MKKKTEKKRKKKMTPSKEAMDQLEAILAQWAKDRE
jgi:hypothetical protein